MKNLKDLLQITDKQVVVLLEDIEKQMNEIYIEKDIFYPISKPESEDIYPILKNNNIKTLDLGNGYIELMVANKGISVKHFKKDLLGLAYVLYYGEYLEDDCMFMRSKNSRINNCKKIHSGLIVEKATEDLENKKIKITDDILFNEIQKICNEIIGKLEKLKNDMDEVEYEIEELNKAYHFIDNWA